MNDAHVTTSDLERIRAGTVTAAEAARIGTHIAGCTRCAATADEALDLQASAERLDAIFTIDENEQSPPVHRFRRRVLFAAAAAAVVIAVMAGVMLVRRGDRDRAVSTPVPSPRSLAPAEPREAPPAPSAAYRPEWTALVNRVRATGVLPLPPLVRDFAESDEFRGASRTTKPDRIWPAGTAVLDDRPALRWPSVEGATYVVTITSGSAIVARSEPLRRTSWTPPQPLRHGETYRWQVAVQHGDASLIIPAPPAPPAMFRVLAGDEWEEIEDAARAAPGDHFLLALLKARAGLIDAARNELERSGDPLAKRLLETLPQR